MLLVAGQCSVPAPIKYVNLLMPFRLPLSLQLFLACHTNQMLYTSSAAMGQPSGMRIYSLPADVL
jgi:hypothetical protein